MTFGPASYCAIASRGTNLLDIVQIGLDGIPYWTQSTDGGSTWSNWTSISGVGVGAPVLISAAANTLDAFIQGTDQNVYWKHYNGSSWTGWAAFGSQSALMQSGDTLSASTPGGGVIDIVYRAVTTNATWYAHYSGSSWGSWTSIGGSMVASPTVQSISSTECWIFSVGGGAVPYYQHYSGGSWSGWTSLGGAVSSVQPVTSYDGTSMFTVWATGSGFYYKRYASGAWGSWTSFSTSAYSQAVLCARGSNVTGCISLGASNYIYYNEWNGSAWSGWSALSTLATTGYAKMSTVSGSSRVDALAINSTVVVGGVLTGGCELNSYSGSTWAGWTPVFDVALPGVTATVSPTANVSVPNVSTPGVTAIVNPTANVPLLDAPYEVGCTAKWDFNHQAGGNVPNSVTPGTDDLTNSGASATLLPGAAAYGYSFASGNYLQDGSDANVNNKTKFTIEFAAAPLSFSITHMVFTKGPWTAGHYFGLYYYGGALNFTRATSSGGGYCAWYTPIIVNANDWHHIVVTVTGTNPQTATATFILDGSPQTFSKYVAGADTTWADDSAYPIIIGKEDTASPIYPFVGSIAFVRYWNNDNLTTAQALQNFNAEKWRWMDVVVSGVTAIANPTANVPIPNVSLPGVTAVATPVGNVPLPNVSTPGVTAIANPTANVPLIIVSLPEVGGAVYPIANIPNIGVSLPEVTSLVTPIANAVNPNVSVPGVTGVVEVIANVPNLMIIIYRHHDVLGLLRGEELRCAGRLTSRGARCVGLLEGNLIIDT